MENYMANGKEVGAEHKFSHCSDRTLCFNDNARAERNYAIGNASPKKEQRDRVKIY